MPDGPNVAILGGERVAEVAAHLDAIDAILRDATVPEDTLFVDLPDDLRWRAHVLACSIRDYTFWVQPTQEPRRERGEWECTEIETGVSAYGDTAFDAVRAYIKM